jgi:hypothetical protein
MKKPTISKKLNGAINAATEAINACNYPDANHMARAAASKVKKENPEAFDHSNPQDIKIFNLCG